jgi:hypothetical protein
MPALRFWPWVPFRPGYRVSHEPPGASGRLKAEEYRAKPVEALERAAKMKDPDMRTSWGSIAGLIRTWWSGWSGTSNRNGFSALAVQDWPNRAVPERFRPWVRQESSLTTSTTVLRWFRSTILANSALRCFMPYSASSLASTMDLEHGTAPIRTPLLKYSIRNTTVPPSRLFIGSTVYRLSRQFATIRRPNDRDFILAGRFRTTDPWAGQTHCLQRAPGIV